METSYGYKVKGKIIIVATGYNTKMFSKRNFASMPTTFNIATKPVTNFDGWNNKILIRDNSDPYTYLRTTKDNQIIIGGDDIDCTSEMFSEDVANEKYCILEQRLKNMFKHIKDIGNLTNLALSIIITGIAYIPGYLNMFLIVSLLLDIQKRLIDNDADDNAISEVAGAKLDMGLDITIIEEKKQGKFNALNNALSNTNTKYLITLDTDTIILPRSVHALVTRIKYSSDDVCSVAGCMLVKNSRENFLSKMQDWDYFFSISVIKRMQGLYQGVLVAQGAFSIYKTDVVKSLGGWSDAIGEDIVLTWKMFSKGYKVYYEPLAIAYTLVPSTFKHFARQRSRWARGMIEAIKEVKPWSTPRALSVTPKTLAAIARVF